MSTAAHSASNALRFQAEGHLYWIGERPVVSVTQVLDKAFPQFKRNFTEEQRERGRAVHEVTAFLDEDIARTDKKYRRSLWNGIRPDWKGYVHAWENAKRDLGIVIIAGGIELRVCSAVYGIAGTLDCVARVQNLDSRFLAVIDKKTGEIPPTTALQTAGYGFCYDPDSEFHRLAIQLMADGKYAVKAYPIAEYRRDVQRFLSAATTAQVKGEYQ